MRDTWGAPAKGWPSFDKNGKRIREDAPEENYDAENAERDAEGYPLHLGAKETCGVCEAQRRVDPGFNVGRSSK